MYHLFYRSRTTLYYFIELRTIHFIVIEQRHTILLNYTRFIYYSRTTLYYFIELCTIHFIVLKQRYIVLLNYVHFILL